MKRPGAEAPIADAEFEEVPRAKGRPRGRAESAQRVTAHVVEEPPPGPVTFGPDGSEANLSATIRPTGVLGALFDAIPVSVRVPLPNIPPSARAGLVFAAGIFGGMAAHHLSHRPAKKPLPHAPGRDDDSRDDDEPE